MPTEKKEPVIEPNTDEYKQQKVQQSRKTAPKKVVQGEVHKKHTAVERAKDEIISEGASTVKEYLVWDVLVPAIKRTLADLGHEAVNLIFGKSGGYYDRDRRDGKQYVQYDRPSYDRPRTRDYYNGRPRDSRPYYSNRRRHSFDDIVIADKRDAENVLDELVESTMRYGLATVKDFYDCLGMPTNYIDGSWGWYELGSARVERVRDGYIVVLPKPQHIEDD